MTIIEFFDSTAIHNALSTLLLSPARLILFGADSMEMYAFSRRLQGILRARRQTVRIQVVPTRTDDFQALSAKLESLVLSHRDCAFDLTGGRTEILAAMGALSQKHSVPMHMTDPVRCRILPLYRAEAYPPVHAVRLSVSEYIGLYGGKITETFAPSPADKAFWQDVRAAWAVCRQDCRGWNTALSALHSFTNPRNNVAELPLSKISKKLSPQKNSALFRTLHRLRDAGLLVDFREEGGCFRFRYKSPAVQHALSKEGAVLELYTYYAAFVHSGRRRIFGDAATGVVMGWADGAVPSKRQDVKNEIDVFLMQGITPVFISCKNGFVDTDELYKLSVVASRFGAPYARAAVILTGHHPDPSFLGRARELGIRVVQSAHTLSPDAFAGKIIEIATKI